MNWPRPITWGALLSATVLLCWPLLTRADLPWGMDTSFAAQMTEGMLRGLADGHLYPRWVDPMTRGFGAPAFVFYPPLAYWITASLGWLLGDIAEAIRVAIIGGVFLSGLSFFLAARPLTSEWGAAFGAALYILLPYHAIDLYDRMAFAELCAFVWTPLVFLFVRRTADTGSTGAALGLAFSYAGLALTHLVTGFIVLFAVIPYGVWRVWQSRRWERLGWLALGGAAGVLLAAAYLLPMLVERDSVHIEYLTESYFGNWRRNFAFRDETLFGFKPDAIKPAINAAVGWQALLAGVACVLVVLRCPAGTRERRDGLAFAVLSAWVVFLQLPISTPLWAGVPELGTVQFPWRFGAVQGLLAPLLCAVALSERRSQHASEHHRGASVPLAAAVAVLALVAAPGVWGGLRLWELRQYVFNNEVAHKLRVQSKPLLEYTPRQALHWRELGGFPLSPATRTGLTGPGEARVLDWSSHERRVGYRSPEAGRLWISTFYHPGWEARLDGEPLPVGPAPGSAMLIAEVPAGEHEVVFSFGSTPARTAGAAISAATLLGLFALMGRGLMGRTALRRRRGAV